MVDGIDRFLRNSEKAELLISLEEVIDRYDKVVIVLIKDNEDTGFNSLVMSLGVDSTYEAYGILDVGKQDLMNEERG